MIKLDHDSHVYYDGDKKIKSVSQILSEAGQVDTRWYTEAGCNRGSAVHEASQAIDEDGMSADDFKGSEIHPYLIAYEKFLNDYNPEWTFIEKLLFCEQLVYAGTADRGAIIKGKEYTIDLKSGGPSFWHGLQLNAYDIAQNKRTEKRILFLMKNGNYKLTDNHRGENFDSQMYRDYWIAIAKKNYYDELYLK